MLQKEPVSSAVRRGAGGLLISEAPGVAWSEANESTVVDMVLARPTQNNDRANVLGILGVSIVL